MKWLALFVAALLVVAACSVGCTDEEEAPPAEPPVEIQPGQVLVGYGDVTGTGQLSGSLSSGTIDTITVTVGLAPGHESVDMEDIAVVYADAIRTESLIPVEGFRGEPPQGTWGIIDVIDQVGNQNNRLDDKEKFVIRINPKSPLVPRQLITISIKPKDGQPLTIRRVSPSTIKQEGNILAPV